MADTQRKAVPAIAAILLALGGYVLICSGRGIWGLLAEVVAVPLGIVGMVMAASPRVTGGMLSIVAIVLGAIGVILGLLVVVFKVISAPFGGP